MKVICIDATQSSNRLVYLNTYTVYREAVYRGVPVYYLDEVYNEPFMKERFIPLSTIDETTFERNYNKEKV